MADDALRAYFKSQGWPMMIHGNPKPIGLLDKGELIALARKYAIMLRTEFGQITTRVIHTIVGPKDISRPARAKRGHGPRKKNSK